MPSLEWQGKRRHQPEAAALVPDSIIYPAGRGYPSAPIENRLFFGDNMGIMAALLPEYEGRFDLIYADPPFFTNRRFAARIGRGEDSRRPADWALAEGYRDSWPDLDAYLDFLYERLLLMHRLLKPAGTLYLHLDWHADAYARILLDEIFGPQRLLNEIIWVYHGPSPIRTAFNRKHDTILSYAKGAGHTFNADAVRQPYNPSTVQTFQASPKAGFGKMPDLERGKVPEDWWYFPVVARLHRERTGYPTQKPEALLERIVLASSNKGELVGDFFCGSGTTAVVASRLGRNFIACDTSFRAVHIARRRLCAAGSPPFSVERQESLSFPLASRHTADVNAGPGTVSIKDLPEIEFWEVDPHWNGRIFCSAAQALRPSPAAPLPLELGIKTGRSLCVRVTTPSGELLQQQLDVEPVSDPPDGL